MKKIQIPDIKKLKQYQPLLFLGAGSYGNVWLCRNIKNNEYVALKKILVESDQERAYQIVENQYILKLRRWFIEKKFKYLEFDAYQSNLKYYLHNVNVDQKIIKIFLINILTALKCLHDQGWCHNDIKEENILIKTQPLQFHLGDLGNVISNKDHGLRDLVMVSHIIWGMLDLKFPLSYRCTIDEVHKNQQIQFMLLKYKPDIFLKKYIYDFLKTIMSKQSILKDISIDNLMNGIKSSQKVNQNINKVKKANKARIKKSQHKKCPKCLRRILKNNFSFHVKSCK